MENGVVKADLNIIDAKTVVGDELVNCCISIAETSVLKMGKEPKLPSASRIFSARGRLVLPGLIDVHTHLRDFEQSYKEDFYSGTCAAAHGGFTTVLAMPNTTPPIDSLSALESAIERASRAVVVNVGFYVSPASIQEAHHCSQLARAFKVNLLHPYSTLPSDDSTLGELMLLSGGARRPVCFHAENRETVSKRAAKIGEAKTYKDFLYVHSISSECQAIERVVRLAEEASSSAHVGHLSSAKGLELVAQAKQHGIRVTAEVTPHHLFLDQRKAGSLGGAGITVPPVRSSGDRQRLWSGLLRGEIDLVASDHAPHAESEKINEDLLKIAPGIAGLETSLPLMLNHSLKMGISPSFLARVMAGKPAEIFNLNGRGTIAEGFVADLIVVDHKAQFRIDPSTFLGKSKLSPFEGITTRGRVILTLVSGRPVFDESGVLADAGSGSVLS